MSVFPIIIGIIAAFILGVLADWLLKPLLPEKPKLKHTIAGIIAILALVSVATWASLTGNPSNDDTAVLHTSSWDNGPSESLSNPGVYFSATETSTPSSVNSSSSTTSTSEPSRAPDDFSLCMALRLIYGNDATIFCDSDGKEPYASWIFTTVIDNKEVYASWSFDGSVEGIKPFPATEPVYVYSRVLLALPFKESNSSKYAVLTETAPDLGNCGHACAPIIGGAIFVWQNNTWQMELPEKIITMIGSFGTAPNGELVKIGPDKHGILFVSPYANHGIQMESTHILAFLDNSINVVFRYPSSENNLVDCLEFQTDCYGYTSEFKFIPGKNPDFYDLKVVTSGSRYVDGRIVDFLEDGTYSLQNDKYQVVK